MLNVDDDDDDDNNDKYITYLCALNDTDFLGTSGLKYWQINKWIIYYV